jgi:hypothetical protein
MEHAASERLFFDVRTGRLFALIWHDAEDGSYHTVFYVGFLQFLKLIARHPCGEASIRLFSTTAYDPLGKLWSFEEAAGVVEAIEGVLNESCSLRCYLWAFWYLFTPCPRKPWKFLWLPEVSRPCDTPLEPLY